MSTEGTGGPGQFWCLSPKEGTQKQYQEMGGGFPLLCHTTLGILLCPSVQHRGKHMKSATQGQRLVSEQPGTAIYDKGMDAIVPVVQSSEGKGRRKGRAISQL